MSFVRAAALELLRPVEINDLALNTTVYYAADLSFTALDIGLSSALFGIVTLLVVLAVVFLIRKGLGHTCVRILLPSTLLLYGSTALYTASLASHIASVDRLVAQAQAGLFSDAFTSAEVDAFKSDVLKQSWMMTIAVSINVLIGDSIVWWRVCVVWRNRIVYCVGPLLIALTIAFGAKSLTGVHQCLHSCRQPQFIFSPGIPVVICAVLSLAVNLIATGLIGYKTWVHWRLLRGHLGRGHHRSRVVKALALLLESGAMYCLLLLIMVVYKATPALFAAPDVHQSAFFQAVADYTYACFTYVIAIYPVLIIVIVAHNWSPIERGLMDFIHLSDGHGSGRSGSTATHLGFSETTMGTDITHVRSASRDVEDGPSEMEAKPASLSNIPSQRFTDPTMLLASGPGRPGRSARLSNIMINS